MATGLDLTVYNDPFTGYYEIPGLALYTDHTFTVDAVPPGYETVVEIVTPDDDPYEQDFPLYVDVEGCGAPGYQPEYDVFFNFEGTDGGFTVSGTTSWAWGMPTSGPGEAHSGDYVWATKTGGSVRHQRGWLYHPPAIDLTFLGTDTPVLEWYQWLVSESGYDYAPVQVSKDGGTTWTNAMVKSAARLTRPGPSTRWCWIHLQRGELPCPLPLPHRQLCDL